LAARSIRSAAILSGLKGLISRDRNQRSQGVVHCLGIFEHLRDIGVQPHNVRSFLIELPAHAPAEVVLITHLVFLFYITVLTHMIFSLGELPLAQ
jgi:hypothetical protein